MPVLPAPPHVAAENDNSEFATLLRDLALVWHDFRSRMFRTPFVQKIIQNQITQTDYLRWMESWIPQVREGSRWMRAAIPQIQKPYEELRELIEHHASEEQFDFKVLFEDYRSAGGPVATLEDLKRNAGGEALNAFMYGRASETNPIDLLGAIYIIEGTGSRIIPTLLPLLRKQLPFSDGVFKFLRYHGANDENHLNEWRTAVEVALKQAPDAAAARAHILQTAKTTAALYLMQMEEVR